MYLEHFGLREPPFRITPNTGFFFAGANRGPTLEALVFAVMHDEGIVKVSGEVGAGKTMLCRMLLGQLPASVDTLYLANPTLGPEDLLRMIAEELEVCPATSNSGVLLLAIQQALIDRYAAGRRVVALVDEAHAMPPGALEQIRLLSNLETDNQKLLQIVLFGQPELDELLDRRSMRQLRDRITQHFRLAPMSRREIAGYLDFRLRTAGYRGPELFSGRAVGLLASASGGLLRRVNILADKALLAAYAHGERSLRPRHVAAAVRDSEYPMPRRWAAWIGVPLAAAGLGLAAFALPELGAPLPPPSGTPTGTPSASPPEAPAAHPAPPETRALASAAREPPVVPAAQAPPPPGPEPVPSGPAPAEPATLDATPHPALGPLAARHQRDTAAWVARSDPRRWFLQLRTIDGGRAAELDAGIEALLAELDAGQLRVYVRDLGHATRVGLIYGDYPSGEQALAALRALPEAVRAGGAYPRQVRGLR